jgi:CTP synthase (UTP-ammonia lyase)
MKKVRIGIIGEYNPVKKTHSLLNQSLDWLKDDYDFGYEWIDTNDVEANCINVLNGLAGIWSASGTPFNSLNGAIKAIEYARIHDIPHLGTCGGFQHAIIEFARNTLGIKDAGHEEYNDDSSVLFISRLSCSLAGRAMTIQIQEGSKAYNSYNQSEVEEDYYCSFGINPSFKKDLENSSELLISGVDQDNEIRIIEIPRNRFFVATLFVPHSKSTKDKPHPIIKAFVEESMRKVY